MGNLNLPQIAAAQAQKHQTSNDADDFLDLALTEVLAVNLASSSVTLTSAQFREAFLFDCTGHSVARELICPAVKRPFAVRNGGTGAITVRGGSGSPLGSASVAAGDTGFFYSTGTTLRAIASSGGAVSNPYDVGGTLNGVPTASQVLLRYPFPRTVVFPAALAGSRGFAAVGPTAQTDFNIRKNGTNVGTMRFKTGSPNNHGEFIMASQTTFNVGDVMTVVAPASPDATLADIGFALVGTR